MHDLSALRFIVGRKLSASAYTPERREKGLAWAEQASEDEIVKWLNKRQRGTP